MLPVGAYLGDFKVKTVMSLTKKSASPCSRQLGHFKEKDALFMSTVVPKMDAMCEFFL